MVHLSYKSNAACAYLVKRAAAFFLLPLHSYGDMNSEPFEKDTYTPSSYSHVAFGAVPVKVFVENVFKNVFNWMKEPILEYIMASDKRIFFTTTIETHVI